MERLSASELLDRNDRQSGNISPDRDGGLFSTWPDSEKLGCCCRHCCCMDGLSNWTALQKSALQKKEEKKRVACVDWDAGVRKSRESNTSDLTKKLK